MPRGAGSRRRHAGSTSQERVTQSRKGAKREARHRIKADRATSYAQNAKQRERTRRETADEQRKTASKKETQRATYVRLIKRNETTS